VVDGVVDRGCGVRVESDAVEPDDAQRQDAATEARAHAPEPVAGTRRRDARDRGAVAEAGWISRVFVVVHEVVARPDGTCEVGVRGGGTGVDDRPDDVG
jgi:hypothetical protein